MKSARILVVALLVAGCLLGCRKKAVKHIAIGTGGTTGVYYPAGGAMASLLNKKTDLYGLQASAQSTGGSVFNINAVIKGDLDFGIAQSDRQYQAIKGLAEWENTGPQASLRAVCSLHPEMVTLVAAVDSGVQSVADLEGKKVNLGNPGSGQRGNAQDVLRTAGVEDTVIPESLKPAESAGMLQDGRIDAFFYTVGHPNGAIKEATAGQRRDVRFVPIEGMEKLLAASPYYATAKIPIALYPNARNDADVPTIGVMTTLVTSSNVPDDVVYALTRELFENLDQFKESHPAFAALTPEGMLRGLSAPLHPGARKYFVEAGLMEAE
jgi:uncharacterized protein